MEPGHFAVWSLGAFVIATIVQEYARAIRVRVRKGGENAGQAFLALLRKNSLLTRDSRMKERKKYGQPGARKRFQFSKR